MRTTVLVIPGGLHGDTPADKVVGVRPQKWSDEQWANLVERNLRYYGVNLEEREWEYGEC